MVGRIRKPAISLVQGFPLKASRFPPLQIWTDRAVSLPFLFSVPTTAHMPVGCLVSHFSEVSSMSDYSLGKEGESRIQQNPHGRFIGGKGCRGSLWRWGWEQRKKEGGERGLPFMRRYSAVRRKWLYSGGTDVYLSCQVPESRPA